MCGIALIISGVRIDLSSLLLDASIYAPPSPESSTLLFSIDDIKSALRRRGPDSLGSKSIFLHAHEGRILQSSVEEECDNCKNSGEVFGGIELSTYSNDAEILIEYLSKCCNCRSHEHDSTCSSGKYSVPEFLSKIKGPWALIYWQESSKTIWFGRDALGRRSLLIHWPNMKDSRLMLSSVSPPYAINENSDFVYENGLKEPSFWEELPCAVYSLSMDASKTGENLVGEVKRHNWHDPLLQELIKWDRTLVEPTPENINKFHETYSSEQRACLHQEVLAALKESVRRRTIFSGIHLCSSPVAVLFSGGLDSMILAAEKP